MIYKNAQVFCEDRWTKSNISVNEQGILAMGSSSSDSSNSNSSSGSSSSDSVDEVVNLEGLFIMPGIVDVHTHGCIGKDFSQASIEDMREMEEYYLSKGVTSIIATLITSSVEDTERAVQRIASYMKSRPHCIIKGIHLEGPFFGVPKKGAHDEALLRPIDGKWFEHLDELAEGKIKIMSLDPTLDNASKFIEEYSPSKIISIGHTIATYEQGVTAVKLGAKQITHLFNGMNSLHHREPGLIGVMNDCDVKAEIIVDAIHLHPSVIRMCFKLNPEKMIIISDSISAAGLRDGEKCISGGLEVTIKENKAVLEDGTIAGSICMGVDSLKQMRIYGIDEVVSIQSMTKYPAEVIKEKVGVIKDGYIADLLVVDEHYDIKAMIRGNDFRWIDDKNS